MWEPRDPAYPTVNTTLPGSWRSTFRLNCCTRPCLKSKFSELTFPSNCPGVGGAVAKANPLEIIMCGPPAGESPPFAALEQAGLGTEGVGAGQRSGKKKEPPAVSS